MQARLGAHATGSRAPTARSRAGRQRALDDMAEERTIFKVAPPARSVALDPSPGAILA
jgi:hypothetical protein